VLTPYVFATERPRRLSDVERETLGVFLEPRERTPRQKPTPVPREKVGHYPVHVRFSDVDVYGHVNNVKYFEYFQEARILLQARLWRDLADWDPSVVVAQLDADYKIPILFRPETYDLWSSVSRVGERSMTIESEICDGDTVLSRARSVIVFFDPASGRSTAPPTAYRERLLAVLA